MEENGEDEEIYGDEGKLRMERYVETEWIIGGWRCDEVFYYDFFFLGFLCEERQRMKIAVRVYPGF